MSATLITQSGRTKRLPDHLEQKDVLGLDAEGRIVVRLDFMTDYAYGLTLCCNAFDKGMEDGVYCRACYGAKSDDTGAYLDVVDGKVVGLDPTTWIED